MKRLIKTIVMSLVLVMGFSGSALAVSQPQTYVALGDSVAAGAGLPVSSNASDEDVLCRRSTQAYPYVVAQTTGMSLQHFACTGAKTDEGVYDDQEIDSGIVPAQLDRAFGTGTPGLITITIGANDARWTQFLRQCYYFRCGYGIDTGRSAVYLADLRLELNILMAKIHQMSEGTPPPVLINGYYNPFSTRTCEEIPAITTSEAAWLDERVASLNRAINVTVSRYSYAHYVPVDFSGHDLCSSSPWVQGLRDDIPFHPTAVGQRAIAQENIAAYNQVTSGESPAGANSFRERLLELFGRSKWW